MFQLLNNRCGHYLLLIAAAALLYIPGLGTPSLWDIDEGNNAECAWEMLDSGNWIVPTFNHELRPDKPALLYWCQVAAYHSCGVGEFAARLPSALAALLTVLLTYELGRRLFDAGVALLGGMVLASTLMFCGSAHFANPDALLNACTVLTFLLFWNSFRRNDPGWLVWCGVSTGLGFLAKGPVGLVLPVAVINLFLLWSRQLRRSLHPQMLVGVLLWILVAVPWFALVGAETKGEFLRGFFVTHNFWRAARAMEGHGGPFYYHAISLLLGFLPWSVFLLPVLGNVYREVRDTDTDDSPRQAMRFLVCWIAVYFIAFSISRTKLPNYILPLYPAVALLTGRFLDRWRRGVIELRRGMMAAGVGGWALVGIGITIGLLVVSGVIDVPRLRHRFPGLAEVAWLGGVLPLGAVAAWRWRQWRAGVLGSLGASAVLFVSGIFLWGAPALDAYKAPRPLVAETGTRQLERDVRIACYDYFEPSLVFYCGRKVDRFEKEKVDKVREFLQCPLPAYLFVPAPRWEEIKAAMPSDMHLLGRHWDLYRNCEVLVIGNGTR